MSLREGKREGERDMRKRERENIMHIIWFVRTYEEFEI
jgi:hypothetical protein